MNMSTQGLRAPRLPDNASVPVELRFRFAGRELVARQGDTIASALLANEVRSWRRTRVAGRPRGLWCGAGVCFDCLVDVNGERAIRACLRLVTAGDVVAVSASIGGPAETSDP